MLDDRSAAGELHRELVTAFTGYVAGRLEALGIDPPPGIEESVTAARRWLDGALRDLLSRPVAEQRRSPLEVFREALAFPTGALEEAGIPPVGRDRAAEVALPGDRYDLAPASSRVLGEAAWEAHLRWGASKAEAMRGLVAPARPPRPIAGLFGTDLMDRTRIAAAAAAAGYDLEVWRSLAGVAAPRPPVVAFVDLTHPEADAAVRTLAGSGVRVIAFGPHVDDLALARAGTLGASDALPRSRFFTRLERRFPAVS